MDTIERGNGPRGGRSGVKRRVLALLCSPAPLAEITAQILELPLRKAVHPLFSALCSNREIVRWRAISAMGQAVAALAREDFEACRVIMRRLMWSLNDESGGIGWGAPEAMAEIMVCEARLAGEYAHILVSYMREDGNFLEHEVLQRGLLWGIGRLAGERPGLMRQWEAPRYLLPYLEAEDPAVRGLAARAAGILKILEARPALTAMLDDKTPITVYLPPELVKRRVGELAAEALAALKTHQGGEQK